MRLRRFSGILSIALVLALATSAAAQHHDHHDDRALAADPRRADGPIAPVLEGLGEHHHPVTTDSERAQLFFDQGLKLIYGFNHREALRAFKEAARLDPDCVMAYWGWALALGPNINLPMMPDVVVQAYEAIQLAKAKAQADGVTAKERAYVEALAARYAADPEADRAPLDSAYAEAMRELHETYPDDLDAATLYADALMNLSPWNYWTGDGRPREHTPEILATLEQVIERDPEHEGALHLYIHAVEPVDPERGVAAADRLRGLTPSAGHLVHMPSHIYMQVGRYADAWEDNVAAAAADESYIAQCRAQGIYPLGYYPHNVHFQVWAAMLQGRADAALETARKVASTVPEKLDENYWGLYQTFLAMPLHVLVRFGRWQEILAEPRPPTTMRALSGVWHYARGLAYVHTGQPRQAKKELATLSHLAADPASAEDYLGFSNARQLLTIAREVLAGEIAAARGRHDDALGHLSRAARLEDALAYNEPPDWPQPVRHTLGAALLEAGHPAEAEVVYWQDLRKNRDNGYALHGLWRSLVAQGRDEDAAEIQARLREAWSDADVELGSSRY